MSSRDTNIRSLIRNKTDGAKRKGYTRRECRHLEPAPSFPAPSRGNFWCRRLGEKPESTRNIVRYSFCIHEKQTKVNYNEFGKEEVATIKRVYCVVCARCRDRGGKSTFYLN